MVPYGRVFAAMVARVCTIKPQTPVGEFRVGVEGGGGGGGGRQALCVLWPLSWLCR